MSKQPQPNAKPKPRQPRTAPAQRGTSLASSAALVPDPLPPPAHLSVAAAQVWRETITQIAAHGTVDAADAATLETFVAAILRQRRIMAEIEAAPLMDEQGKLSPLLRYASSTSATVKGLAHVLGLNPVARLRLPKAPRKAAGGDKWGDL